MNSNKGECHCQSLLYTDFRFFGCKFFLWRAEVRRFEICEDERFVLLTKFRILKMCDIFRNGNVVKNKGLEIHYI